MIGRRKMLKRKASLKPRVVNHRKTHITRKPRPQAETLRIYGPPERREWVRWLPSVVSGYRPCVQAHVRSGGMGRKADYCYIVPLTDAEHKELHAIGITSFEAKYGVNLEQMAEYVERAWVAFRGKSA